MWKIPPVGFNTLVDSMQKTTKREPRSVDKTTTYRNIIRIFSERRLHCLKL